MREAISHARSCVAWSRARCHYWALGRTKNSRAFSRHQRWGELQAHWSSCFNLPRGVTTLRYPNVLPIYLASIDRLSISLTRYQLLCDFPSNRFTKLPCFFFHSTFFSFLFTSFILGPVCPIRFCLLFFVRSFPGFSSERVCCSRSCTEQIMFVERAFDVKL